MPAWAERAVEDYLARFPRDFEVALKQVRPEPRREQPVAHCLRAEQLRLRAAAPPGDRLVALDERGVDWTWCCTRSRMRCRNGPAAPMACPSSSNRKPSCGCGYPA